MILGHRDVFFDRQATPARSLRGPAGPPPSRRPPPSSATLLLGYSVVLVAININARSRFANSSHSSHSSPSCYDDSQLRDAGDGS
mmetsp:Transcript_35876/g.85538  ORF Transcript_35876/g.85538 Transcript_35876/m.85538 type:complete len:85 (-) Transcript_35876:112-366(-)